MIIITTKQAVNVQAVLASLTGEFALRSAQAIAQEAGITVAEAESICSSLGLVQKRRRADGYTLFGIAGRVDGCDEQHVPETVWNNPDEAPNNGAADREVIAVREALRDRRWATRSFTALKAAADVSEHRLYEILNAIGARIDGRFARLG